MSERPEFGECVAAGMLLLLLIAISPALLLALLMYLPGRLFLWVLDKRGGHR